MKQDLINEIDFNLFCRADFKKLLDILKEDNKLITDVDPDLIELKVGTMEASYDDFSFFLVKLLNDTYLSKEEANHITNVIKEMDMSDFYADSEELIHEIKKTEEKIGKGNFAENINVLKQKCKNKYDQYVLQRAAFAFDYIIDID